MGIYGYKYTPFSRDQLDKQPDACRRSFYELLGRYTSIAGSRAMDELTVYEREVIRYSFSLHRHIRLEDVCYCFQLKHEAARTVIKNMVLKRLLIPIGTGTMRFHEYQVHPDAKDYFLYELRLF